MLELLQRVINISSNLCVNEQPIRRQNLFVRWLLNGVIETICSVRRNTIVELAYRKEFNAPGNVNHGAPTPGT